MFLPICAIPLTAVRRERFERIFRGALDDARLTLDQGAREAEKDTSQFKRILACVERHLDPLTKQGDDFWRALAENIYAELGSSRRARLAAKLRALTIGKRRQLRVHAQKVKQAS